jgi:MFS family permease
MAQSFVLAGLAFMHEAPLILFYLTAIAGGCFLAIDNPVRRSMVNEMVPADDVPNAVTLYSAMINISRIVGPLIAGVLVVSVGYGWCFTIDALSYTTVLVSLSMMRASELRQLPITPRAPGQIRAGLRYILTVPDLWIPFTMLLIIGTISYNFSVVLPLFVVKGLHENKAAYTYVYAAFSTGGLLGALLVARRSKVVIRTVAVGAVGLGVTMLVLSASPNLVFAVVVALAVGALALGERPVVIRRAVHEQDLRLVVRARLPHDATGGADHALARLLVAGAQVSHDLGSSLRAAFHTARHADRFASASTRSTSISWPATRASSGDSPTATERNQARATQASWWSPRTSWSSPMSSARRCAGRPTTPTANSAAYRARLARMRSWCNSVSFGFRPIFRAPLASAL